MDESNPKRILAVFAHPDDESFAAGGTLAKYAKRNVRVVLLCATRGEAGIPGVESEQAGKIREGELRNAAKQLGIEVLFQDCHDGGLAACNREMLTESMAWWIDLIQPQVIITFGPEGVSGHADHVTVSQVVTQAYDRFYRKGLLLYIRPSEATELGRGATSSEKDEVLPLLKVDISEYRREKALAIRSHVSQNPDLPENPEEAKEMIPSYELFSIARNATIAKDYPAWFEPEGLK